MVPPPMLMVPPLMLRQAPLSEVKGSCQTIEGVVMVEPMEMCQVPMPSVPAEKMTLSPSTHGAGTVRPAGSVVQLTPSQLLPLLPQPAAV